MAEMAFAKHTNSILNMLPHWFKMRKESEDSTGARFLNVSGLELDDARYVIDYAYDQCYIDSVDLNQVDFCYKVIVPMPYKVSNITNVFANSTGLSKAKNLKEFFGIDQHGVTDSVLYSFEKYFIDESHNIIYVRQKFNADAINNDGKIKLVFGEEEFIYPLIPHQVWNFLDELGTLVSCLRLPEEPNIEYKQRILDVFKNYAGASKDGLINGIGRELATRRYITWTNPKTDLELDDAMIVLNSIKIDGEYVDKSRVFLTAAGTVMIKALPDDKAYSHEVTYVYGLEMHQLWNKNDIKLQNELFTIEGKPKAKIKKYMDILNSESPIFWDSFHWNEHYWDQNEANVSGVGYIPHLYDGSIQGFKKYKG